MKQFFRQPQLSANGFSFVEVLVAVVIIAACAVPVVYMVTSARTDTSKAINYLRAMELANEVIEWAQISRFGMVDEGVFSGITGPVTLDDGGTLKAAKIAVGPSDYESWNTDNLIANELQYSEQYNNAFFYRNVKIEDITDSIISDNMLKKVVVTVKWCEGTRPPNPNIDEGRTRQVQLSVLLLNEHNPKY